MPAQSGQQGSGNKVVNIVFDLDGTLIDSAPDIQKTANDLLNGDGILPITAAETQSFIGNGVGVFIQKMCVARGIHSSKEPAYHKAFLQAYESGFELTRPYPNVVKTLGALKSQNHTLGICTNKPIGPCRAILAHLDLTRFFDVIIGGDSLPVRKPDPAPLFSAFDGLPEGGRIYVGDSEVDAETAQRAQVPFLLFTEGYRHTPIQDLPHSAAFSHFDELCDLVEKNPL